MTTAAYELRAATGEHVHGHDLVRVSDGAVLAHDYGEPEDREFRRDLAGILPELNSLSGVAATWRRGVEDANRIAQRFEQEQGAAVALLREIVDLGHFDEPDPNAVCLVCDSPWNAHAATCKLADLEKRIRAFLAPRARPAADVTPPPTACEYVGPCDGSFCADAACAEPTRVAA